MQPFGPSTDSLITVIVSKVLESSSLSMSMKIGDAILACNGRGVKDCADVSESDVDAALCT